MSEIRFYPLPDACRPLLGKFYREHQSSMRAASKGQAWVAKQAEIIGALCLTPVAEGHWLTGLFVAPPHAREDSGAKLDRCRAATAGRAGVAVLPS
ncbi:Acetyltransferase [Pseudomonas savastanoi]|uniref:Acetyltransferase n=1 Tax=Pseudomonas savastanoi TaxID=29438 RepID=A0A3M5FRP9_PSESS|nr:Acetyltransferase [Pseudomonas savastanoi]